MASLGKLLKSKFILEKLLSPYIIQLYFEPKLARIRIILRDEIILYIQYNNYDEYSYSILFSQIVLDRCRFDNYDDRWKVSTRPHHFHPRFNKVGFQSPMNSDPEHDIPLLCNYVKSGKTLSSKLRFEI